MDDGKLGLLKRRLQDAQQQQSLALDVSGLWEPGREGVEELCATLTVLPTLEELNIANTNYEDDEGLREVARCIVSLSSLQKLVFSSKPHREASGWRDAIEITMTTRDTTAPPVSSPTEAVIFTAFLPRCKSIKSVSFGQNRLQEGMSTVELHGEVQDWEAQVFAAFIPRCKVLSTLNLADATLSLAGVKAFASPIREHEALTRIIFVGEGDDDSEDPPKIVTVDMAQDSADLCNKRLGVQGANLLGPFLGRNKLLKSSNLLQNQLQKKGANLIVAATESNRGLGTLCGFKEGQEEVRVDNNSVGPRGSYLATSTALSHLLAFLLLLLSPPPTSPHLRKTPPPSPYPQVILAKQSPPLDVGDAILIGADLQRPGCAIRALILSHNKLAGEASGKALSDALMLNHPRSGQGMGLTELDVSYNLPHMDRPGSGVSFATALAAGEKAWSALSDSDLCND
jgi:hypothetical protein